MSEQIEINNSNFLPATVAARQAGYTPDYITRLAREGKIRAQKVGRQWYVHFQDVSNFASSAEEGRTLRGKELSAVRKIEHEQHQSRIQKQPVEWSVPGKLAALSKTLVIVAFGLSFGALNYFSVPASQHARVFDSQVSFLESFAAAFYEFITPRPAQVSVEPDLQDFKTNLGTEDFVSEQESRSYVIQLSPSERADVVAGAFSDEIDVIFDVEMPNSGVIKPSFKESGSTTESQFTFELKIGEVATSSP